MPTANAFEPSFGTSPSRQSEPVKGVSHSRSATEIA